MRGKSEKPSDKRSILYLLWRVGKMMCKTSPFWVIILQVAAVFYGLSCGFQILVTRDFFDSIAQEAGRQNGIGVMLFPALFFGGILLLTQLLGGVDQFLVNPAVTSMERALKQEVFAKAARVNPIEFESPVFLNELNSTTLYIYMVLHSPLAVLRIFSFYLPYFFVTVSFYFSLRPELLLGILAIFVPTLITLFVRRKIHTELENVSRSLRRRYQYAEKAIGDREFFKETRLLGAFGLLSGIYNETVDLLNRHTWKAEKKITWIETGLRLLTLTGYIGILWLMFVYLLDGRISVGSFAAVFSSIGMLIQFLEEILIREMGYIARFAGHTESLVKYFDLPERSGAAIVPKKAGIDFENVTFRYPGKEEDTIKGVSLSIEPGETIAIVGDNGAGKTTLIRLMSGLYLPKEGTVKVGGVDTKKASPESIFTYFSAVFQNYQRYRTTLRDNILAGDSKNEDPTEALNKADVDSKGDSFPKGFDTMLSREFGGVDISGGQWQRVAIARAYHRKHSIILLDEPTAAIDPVEETRIYNQFAKISKDKTTIIVTHRMGSVKIANRIVVMKDGQIEDIGNHDELMSRGGHYADMWAAQAKWYE